MSLTTILNKIYVPHDIFASYCPNLLALKKYEKKIIMFDSITLAFDGVIFNYHDLLRFLPYDDDYVCNKYNLFSEDKCVQEKYCHIIIYLYKKYGIDQMLNMLDGVFSLILFDPNDYLENYNLYIVKDFFGEKILNMCALNENLVAFTDNIDEFLDLDFVKRMDDSKYNIVSTESGNYYHFKLSNKILADWEFIERKEYMTFAMTTINTVQYFSVCDYISILNKLLLLAVQKRVNATSDKIAIYTLPKSLLYKIMNIYIDNTSDNKTIFYILESLDLTKNANKAVYSNNDPNSCIADRIKYIYSEDENEISLTMIMNQINEDVVLFDYGMDEIFGHAYCDIIDPIEFDKKTRICFNSLKNEELDTIRKNKTVYNPFFDKELLQFYFSIPLEIRFNLRQNNQLLTNLTMIPS